MKIEERLLPKPPPEMRGSYELHYTEAWPDCQNFSGVECQHCTEHGPNCAVVINPISAPIRRVIVMQGAGAGPWLGIG
jgi:hypothetical protein